MREGGHSRNVPATQVRTYPTQGFVYELLRTCTVRTLRTESFQAFTAAAAAAQPNNPQHRPLFLGRRWLGTRQTAAATGEPPLPPKPLNTSGRSSTAQHRKTPATAPQVDDIALDRIREWLPRSPSNHSSIMRCIAITIMNKCLQISVWAKEMCGRRKSKATRRGEEIAEVLT